MVEVLTPPCDVVISAEVRGKLFENIVYME